MIGMEMMGIRMSEIITMRAGMGHSGRRRRRKGWGILEVRREGGERRIPGRREHTFISRGVYGGCPMGVSWGFRQFGLVYVMENEVMVPLGIRFSPQEAEPTSSFVSLETYQIEAEKGVSVGIPEGIEAAPASFPFFLSHFSLALLILAFDTLVLSYKKMWGLLTPKHYEKTNKLHPPSEHTPYQHPSSSPPQSRN